jgi:diguanylate cyclase
LPNAELFQDRLVNALVQAERHQWRIAVMFIDLDSFKSVNDTHGHDVGDCLLKIVAQRLQKLVRRGDTVSRRSGDEFLFLMPEAKNKETVVKLAGKITGKIADPCRIGELEVSTSASVGIAVYPEDGRFPNELLKNADAAMYEAKKKRAAFTFYREFVNQ